MTWTDWAEVEGEGLAFDEIKYEKKHHQGLGGGVARVTIDKAEKYNTMALSTVEEMFRAFYEANHDRRVGVIYASSTQAPLLVIFRLQASTPSEAMPPQACSDRKGYGRGETI